MQHDSRGTGVLDATSSETGERVNVHITHTMAQESVKALNPISPRIYQFTPCAYSIPHVPVYTWQ